ncbi:TPA: hypothetical protein DEP34_04075 [Candidatus Uhrbacteria bacterium]|uniref:Nudix hydrolase domain-containing protein n=2 Tax=Candidatus Uhriibacteriota TaxID=1752732 RepID=A0A0G1Q6W4_9BACT|nr:MAG: hypothetical protein UX45_C0012G0034 [Candidatus Uhrbacteria bacterium GW2011_GWF2_46_218]KKU40791.1 MAG: hypothetical protein UX57_C0010G0035 [Candidatus Uhrbacteria bacterium GW2011_GWE2_46_68]HBK34190.1 hypothetical protein [Candidatus Uhrbacteria bacterium]HCB19529.1 hypothetical protein [Candidatus Uhrbacteria bacterium]
MIQSWKQLSSKTVHENPWWKYQLDEFELPNGAKGEYHYMKTRGSVAIIAIDAGGKILLHRQYRYIFDRESLECPAGGIKPDQTPREAATAELAEEIGVRAKILEEVGSFAVGTGLLDDVVKVFIAKDLSFMTSEKDETEEFEHMRLSPEEIDTAIFRGEMWDGVSISAWAIAKLFFKK